MKIIGKGTFAGTEDEYAAQISARVAAFKQALADHANTTGQPAPREDDLIEHLARTNEPFEVERQPAPPPPPPISPEVQAAIDLEIKRAAAVRALDEARLDAAAADPNAPQEVKDYATEKAKKPKS
jgi:hypothetical protein